MTVSTILYVGGFELPDKNAAAHRVLSNGKIFRELGYKVVYIDVDKSLPYDTDILTTFKEVQGFDCWSIPYPNSQIEWLKYLSNIDFMRVMIDKYQDIKIVAAYNYPAWALRNLRKYCSERNIKIIGDCTEWYSTKGTTLVFKLIKGLDSFFRMRVVQKQLDGLIVISRYLEEYYKDCENVVRIPPLVDINEEKWKLTIKEPQKSDNQTSLIRMVYSGNPGRNKDKTNTIVEMFYTMIRYENYHLKIIGITQDQYVQDYPHHIKLLESMKGRIEFLGEVTHSQSLNYLKESDFSIFIRDDNRLTKAGFPTKFVESISCGIPVITTLTSDLHDYLLDGENGFIIEDPKNISNDFSRILEIDCETIERMKDYCARNNPFHYRYHIERMEKLFQFRTNGEPKNHSRGRDYHGPI
jgi:glycosyltransferase involved in cell wall biosynthesis